MVNSYQSSLKMSNNTNISVLIVLSLIGFACSQYPPKLLPKQSNDLNKKVIKTGTSIALQCPVEKSREDEIYFEWYKNGEPIENFDQRIRITNSGVLKIKNSVPEDTGRFLCKAINGFGSVEFLLTLIVLDEDYDEMMAEKERSSQISDLESPLLIDPAYDEGRPQLSQVSKFAQNVIVKKTRSNIRFKCVFTGNPKPDITWFHNSEQFIDSESRKGRNSLVINDLKPEDSGNYTCLAKNLFGTIGHSYNLKVIDNFINKPEIEGNHPLNTSVSVGDSTTLYCSVKSDETPHIQWLKKVDIIPGFGTEVSDDSHYIKVLGELYKTLESTQTTQLSETLFENNLIIFNANGLDGGKYLCLGANTMGSSFRSAFIAVQSSKPKRTNMYSITRQEVLPVLIVIAFVSVVVIIVIALLVWMSMCLCQKSEPNTRVVQSYHWPSKESRSPVPSESNYGHNYAQIVPNKFPTIPSTQVRATSPFYSELFTNDKQLSNAYQLYTNPMDVKSVPYPSNKPYGYLC